MEIFHHKQPFRAAGNVFANSVTRTMKGQSLSAWDMFTRETLQNSWDARDTASNEDGVTFAIDYMDLSPEQIRVLGDNVFANDYEGLDELAKAMNSRKMCALRVSDSGTNGLRGSTSAAAAASKNSDFVSFVRNFGRSDSKEIAGGTYGFGKGVFFISSLVRTIVIYTRTTDEFGTPVSRLIAMAIGNDFQANGISFTGHHYWGIKAFENPGGSEYAEPLVNEPADEIAHVLGMDAYFTDQRPTGTSILVLSPDITDDEGHENALETMNRIAHSLTTWAWPHMVRREDHLDPIEFRVSINGTEIEIPDPQKDPALKHFVMAYANALDMQDRDSKNWEVSYPGLRANIWTGSIKKCLGRVAITFLNAPINKEETVIEKDISRHIALLRRPRMVVEYYKGATNLSDRSYCGVFVADDATDPVFARSEPAAHHQWNQETIAYDTDLLHAFWGKPSKHNPVRILFNRLNAMLKETDRSSQKTGDAKHYAAVTTISDNLGRAISNATSGTSARLGGYVKVKQSAKKAVVTKKNRVSISGLRLFNSGQGVISVFKLEPHLVNPDTREFAVAPTVQSDAGNIFDALKSTGGKIPLITGIFREEPSLQDLIDSSISEESTVISFSNSAPVWIAISQPEATAVSLSINLVEDELDKEE